VGTAACPGTADFRPCAPQAKIYRLVPFKKNFYRVNPKTFFADLVESTLLAGGKSGGEKKWVI
jgi:hypothetical protein